MYKLHLIRKYLVKRRIAWVALIAVMLCTFMVLVVFSVMDGWLQTFEGTFHGMTSDVVVEARNPLVGFPYYAEIIDRIQQKVPGVAAAVPVIKTGALININGRVVNMVQVVGYPPDIGRVNDWPATLHGQAADIAAGKPPSFDLLKDIHYDRLVRGKDAKNAVNRPGIIVTDPVVYIEHGDPPAAVAERRADMVEFPCVLTLLPVAPGEKIDVTAVNSLAVWIVDDCKSRVYQLDAQNVYMGFAELQRQLKMGDSGDDPARCTEILVKAKPGFDANAVRDQVRRVANDVTAGHDAFDYYGYTVETWRDQQVDIISAVRNEVVLTTALFGVMSLVAVLLIFCIFYMIVIEKTKDIGVIKSVGATGGGILALFLGYGLAIGIVGSGVGVLLAAVFVRYINELHTWLGQVTGLQMWTPKTYQFDRIPNKLELQTVVVTVVVALMSAVLGALLPAVRAAGTNPVDSLRYE
jgi:lipoprotein-releasing system permease protein